MAGAVLGEVQVSLFVAGAVLVFKCHFSWQAQYLVKCKIGRKTLYFTIENARGGLEK